MHAREEFLGRARKRLASLHKGLGVRRHNLLTQLGPELARLWGVSDADDLESARAKVVCQLERVFGRQLDDTLARVARVFYNTSTDPRTRDLNLGGRLAVLHDQLGRKYSPTNVNRLMRTVVAQLEVSLARNPPAVPVDKLREAIRQERACLARTVTSPGTDGLRRAIRDLRSPRVLAEHVVRRFLAARLHVPCWPGWRLAVAHTAGLGSWACAFTTGERLLRYQRDAGAPWADEHLVLSGAELVRTVIPRDAGVGVLVDPSAERSAELTETLSLPPELVSRLAVGD
ncbi:hypothetical protein [Goodfellowiella coeruleoviolacea]|uniref:Uncharacterized protein n=1 Tax=Goodfellowiella coeruleoviolacea TaxID=334858 RepID=A0AAE3KJQ9_9PSEU|nr:hypothetical protein [Goodfellowiella coeruleoviolacea]MCP2164588.1 hypothetical protein [Goodfellowiella coeruleoviolacea]